MGLTSGTGPSAGSTSLAALRGGLGFLTRLPVGHRERDWTAFCGTPAAFPLVGYAVGVGLAAPVAVGLWLPLPGPTVAAALLAWTYLLTGVNHVDGLADLGDAAAVHGDAGTRLAALGDTTVGVGALLAVGVGLGGLALAGLALAALPLGSVGLVVAAEVGAKLGMAAVAALGTAATDGLGARLTERATPASLVLPALLAAPAVLLAPPSVTAGAAALLAPVATALALERWATRRLGGVNGDVMGAANELGRVAGLHAGVVAWTLS